MRALSEIGFSYVGLLRPRPAPTKEQLERIEARVGAVLPAEYKDFLTQQNGGVPGKNFIHSGDDEDQGFFVECFNYVDGAEEDIYDVEKASRWPSGPYSNRG